MGDEDGSISRRFLPSDAFAEFLADCEAEGVVMIETPVTRAFLLGSSSPSLPGKTMGEKFKSRLATTEALGLVDAIKSGLNIPRSSP